MGGGGGYRLYFNVIIVAVATHWITLPGVNLVTMVGLREIGKCATEGHSYITANNSEGLTCDPSNYTDDTSVQLPPSHREDVAVWRGWVPELFGATARTPLPPRGARRGEQHLCTRFVNMIPTRPNSKKGRKSFSGGTWRELNMRRVRDCGDGE